MFVPIPKNFQIITFCNFNDKTNTKTTWLLFRALKNITNLKEHIDNLFNYSDCDQKNKNILAFSRVLVSNFLIWSLGKKQISDQTFFQTLKPILSDELIGRIVGIWKSFSLNNKLHSAWSSKNSGFITKLYQFDFITDELIDMVLQETKINISVYKTGEVMKFMNFDELSVFENSDNFTFYNSGIFEINDYTSKSSPIYQILDKSKFIEIKKENESDEITKMRIALKARSQISIEKKFPRYFNIQTFFEKFDGGTFIIPSCGTINNQFNTFFDLHLIDKTIISFFS
jgi:hypothetical protein